jgi:hypothetical protein
MLEFITFDGEIEASVHEVDVEVGVFVRVSYAGDVGTYTVDADTTIKDVVDRFADDYGINVNKIRVKQDGEVVDLTENVVEFATYNLSQLSDVKG